MQEDVQKPASTEIFIKMNWLSRPAEAVTRCGSGESGELGGRAVLSCVAALLRDRGERARGPPSALSWPRDDKIARGEPSYQMRHILLQLFAALGLVVRFVKFVLSLLHRENNLGRVLQ